MVANDPVDAAAALVRLSGEPELWQYCSGKARSAVETSFSADTYFEQWLEVIKQHPWIPRQRSPLTSANMRQVLPFGDASFQSQYSYFNVTWAKNIRLVVRFLQVKAA